MRCGRFTSGRSTAKAKSRSSTTPLRQPKRAAALPPRRAHCLTFRVGHSRDTDTCTLRLPAWLVQRNLDELDGHGLLRQPWHNRGQGACRVQPADLRGSSADRAAYAHAHAYAYRGEPVSAARKSGRCSVPNPFAGSQRTTQSARSRSEPRSPVPLRVSSRTATCPPSQCANNQRCTFDGGFHRPLEGPPNAPATGQPRRQGLSSEARARDRLYS